MILQLSRNQTEGPSNTRRTDLRIMLTELASCEAEEDSGIYTWFGLGKKKPTNVGSFITAYGILSYSATGRSTSSTIAIGALSPGL